MQTLTQHEKDFVVEFLADILHGLTINNVLSRQDYDGFVRMQDALEVMDMLRCCTANTQNNKATGQQAKQLQRGHLH